jgi:hypothetical protein
MQIIKSFPMKRVDFFILFVIWTNILVAQISVNNTMADFKFKKITEENDARFSLKISEIQGTPYLDKEFNPGKITTNEGTVIADIPLRYNGSTDDLEFLKGEDHYVVDPKTLVAKAEFGGKVFSCKQYDINNRTQSGFFEILNEGKATLLIRYTVKFYEKEPPKPFSDPKPARFDNPKKEYYLSFGGLPAKLITTKKSFLELFGNQKDEMDAFISKNKLSIKEDGELKKIVAHFNSL